MTKWRGNKKVDSDGKLRRSQVTQGYGPGALVDLVDRSVIIGGTEHWRYEGAPRTVHEPRLADAVKKQLRGLADINLQAAFREPPSRDGDDASRDSGISVFEFPLWFVCTGCTNLRKLSHTELADTSDKRKHAGCRKEGGGTWLPVRFVGACTNGHVFDFPWSKLAHHQHEGVCDDPYNQLYLDEGVVGDLSEMRVRCKACGAGRDVASAKSDAFQVPCRGEQPWLGVKNEPCDVERISLVSRTASNVYFAQTMSALTLPDSEDELRTRVSRFLVQYGKVVELPGMLETILKADGASFELDTYAVDVVKAMMDRVRSNEATAREDLRTAEYNYLTKNTRTGMPVRPKDEAMPMTERVESELFEHLVLLHRVREVRALVGFTRLSPSVPDLQGKVEVKRAIVGNEQWVPCTEMQGEGVFFALNEERVQEWEARPAVRAREDILRQGFEQWKNKLADQANAPLFPGARFYLLHALSHAIMNRISVACGYASSALHERIYCSDPAAKESFAAVLITTGGGGSEGTLGGLVEEGRKLGTHFEGAQRDLHLCSGDPLCGKRRPTDGAERWLLGAACHNCLFVAEPSCEWFNQRLDRALLFPTMGQDKDCAFFSSLSRLSEPPLG